MQALRNKTASAITQTARRRLEHNKKLAVLKRKERESQENYRSRALRERIKDARKARWEDWYLGPLRGRRAKAEDLPEGLKEPKWVQQKREREREGLLKMQKLRTSPGVKVVTDDRVVITANYGPATRFRGKIGTVTDIRLKEQVCVVEGIMIKQSQARRTAPHYALFTEASANPDLMVPLPIPFSFVRQVKTLINANGQKEDVLIGLLERDRRAARSKTYHQDFVSSDIPSRLSTGENSGLLNAKSPFGSPKFIEQDNEVDSKPQKDFWSRSESKKRARERKAKAKEVENSFRSEPEDPTTDADTLRYEVDAQTWTPTLLRAPLPTPVIDELRGKYSVFRTRHDEAFVKALQAKDERQRRFGEWASRGGGVWDAAGRKNVEGRAVGRRRRAKPDVDVLARLGETMALRGKVRLQEQTAVD